MSAYNMNVKILIILIFLLLIPSIYLFIHTAAAQPDFYIYVYDSYGNSVDRANVIIYQNGEEIDRGRTNNGYWRTQLNRGERYRIEANKGSQSGSWSGMLNSDEISIYMD